jgi:hypothetical protein
MCRTVADIDGEITASKTGNLNWMSNSVTMALITGLINEKNQLDEFK